MFYPPRRRFILCARLPRRTRRARRGWKTSLILTLTLRHRRRKGMCRPLRRQGRDMAPPQRRSAPASNFPSNLRGRLCASYRSGTCCDSCRRLRSRSLTGSISPQRSSLRGGMGKNSTFIYRSIKMLLSFSASPVCIWMRISTRRIYAETRNLSSNQRTGSP